MARCRICRTEYKKWRISQKVCGNPDCAEAFVEQEKNKAAMKALRAAKEKLKTRRDYMKEAQIAFNAFIRERDKGKACISCGAAWSSGAVGGSFDCGHYRSVGSAPHLRFDERNAHGQCKKCNRYGAGRAVDYRIALAHRICSEALESLESDQTPKNYTIDDLKAIKAHYRAKLKEMKAND